MKGCAYIWQNGLYVAATPRGIKRHVYFSVGMERQIGFIALLLTSRVFDTNMSSALELVKEVRVALPTSLAITTKAAQTESSVSLTSVKFYSSGQINAKFWALPFSMPDSGVNNEYVRAVKQ